MSVPKTAVPSYYLRTKLYRPPLPEDHVLRLRLLAELQKTSHYQVAGIIAPAGFGKSTLASAWVEQVHCPHAWLSLDEGDDDLVVFFGYLLTAIRSLFPDFGEKILALTRAATRPLPQTLSSYLLHAFDQLEQDFVLVLDDFHVITNPDIHEVLAGVLRYPLPCFHLVLISRHNLPPQLSKLQAKSRLLELRSKDLCFTLDEVAAFVEKALPISSDPQTVEILTTKTDGWPVGLRLAAIALRRWGISDHQPAILQVDNQYVIDYLVNEVLAGQPVSVRGFLLKSSILDRFCAPLCAALLDVDELDPNIMEQLEQEGVFIEALDNQRDWYRFHHLFRDLLRKRLAEQVTAVEIASLHLRASQWLAANGFVEDALDHALLSGDMDTAVNILYTQAIQLVNEERWLLLESLLNKFTPDVINETPKLLLLLAWLNQARSQFGYLEAIRTRLEHYPSTAALPTEEQQFLESSLHTFAAAIFNWQPDFEKAIYHGRQALNIAPQAWGLMRGYAWLHLATASYYLHGGDVGLTILTEDDHLSISVLNQIRKQIAIAFIDWLSGDLVKLLHSTHHGLDLIDDRRLATSQSMLNCLAGSACYARNDLALAAQHFEAVLVLETGAQPFAFLVSTIGQALIYQAQNEIDKAKQLVDTAVTFFLDLNLSSQLFAIESFQAELALQQGELDKASFWAARQKDKMPQTANMPFLYQPQMTLPKIWLAERTPSSLMLAEAELNRLYRIVTATHNLPCQIKVLTLQAQLYQVQNKPQEAADTLAQAVRLAQPGGFIRLFVDMGPQTAVLLKHLYMQEYAVSFIQQILDAFPISRLAPSKTAPLALIESLTEREMEVLTLLAERLSNKEISNILVISPETVKRHSSNIYQKLQVKNRRQAVAKAHKLGLLVDVA